MATVPGYIPALFAEPSELGAYLGETFTDVDTTAALLMLEIATGAVQSYCRQRIERVADDSVVLEGGGKRSLFLPERPVTAVTSVTVSGDALTVDEDYQWNAEGILRHASVWPAGKLVTVIYSHGHDPIPADIRGVVLAAAARMYVAGGGVLSESIGSYSVTYGRAMGGDMVGAPLLTSAERRLLDRYRHQALA